MSVNDDCLFHDDLIFQSIEKIEMNYVRAIERGDVNPVVLVLHLSDDLARTFAEQLGSASGSPACSPTPAAMSRQQWSSDFRRGEAGRIAEKFLWDLQASLKVRCRPGLHRRRGGPRRGHGHDLATRAGLRRQRRLR